MNLILQASKGLPSKIDLTNLRLLAITIEDLLVPRDSLKFFTGWPELRKQKLESQKFCTCWVDLVCVWIRIISSCVCVFWLLFFFLVPAALFDQVNHKQCAHILFTNPQISLFSNFFIKNEFYDIVHTFKNYFAIVFLVLIFSFSKNKLNPNERLKWKTCWESRRQPTGPSVRAGIGLSSGGLAGLLGFDRVWTTLVGTTMHNFLNFSIHVISGYFTPIEL